MFNLSKCKTQSRVGWVVNSLVVVFISLSIGIANSKDAGRQTKESQSDELQTTESQVITEPKVKIERFKWNGQLPKNKTIIVKNHYGDISTKTISKPIVHLQSVYQRIGQDAPKPTFQIEETVNGLEVEINYPKNYFKSRPNESAVRADIGIYFPKGYRLVAETSFGNIKAKKHHSDIKAKTTIGNISVATHGAVDLSSEAGHIFLNPLSSRWKETQQVLTRAGNVTLLLPKKIDLKLVVQAGKGVVSNFKRNGIPSSSDGFGHFTSNLGKALTSLNIKALNGSAELIYERKTDEDYLVGHLN